MPTGHQVVADPRGRRIYKGEMDLPGVLPDSYPHLQVSAPETTAFGKRSAGIGRRERVLQRTVDPPLTSTSSVYWNDCCHDVACHGLGSFAPSWLGAELSETPGEAPEGSMSSSNHETMPLVTPPAATRMALTAMRPKLARKEGAQRHQRGRRAVSRVTRWREGRATSDQLAGQTMRDLHAQDKVCLPLRAFLLRTVLSSTNRAVNTSLQAASVSLQPPAASPRMMQRGAVPRERVLLACYSNCAPLRT